MERNTRAPAVGGGPDQQRYQDNHYRQAEHTVRTHHAEIDQDDNGGNWQPITDDGEGPRITGITHEDQAANWTALRMGPPGKQSPLAAVGATVAQSAPDRPAYQLRVGRPHPSGLKKRARKAKRAGNAKRHPGILLRIRFTHLRFQVPPRGEGRCSSSLLNAPYTGLPQLISCFGRDLS